MHQNESLREGPLAEIAAIAPILTEQAPESEKLGCLTDGTWQPLRGSRLLGFLTPPELGGDEADPLTQMEVNGGAGTDRCLRKLGGWQLGPGQCVWSRFPPCAVRSTDFRRACPSYGRDERAQRPG